MLRPEHAPARLKKLWLVRLTTVGRSVRADISSDSSIGQAPCHLHLQRAGIALLAVGTGARKRHGRTRAIVDRDNPPVAPVESVRPAMQSIVAVIGRELHHGAVEREARPRDTVGIAADGRAEETPAGEISIERVMTE